MLVFEEREKPENPKKNLSDKGENQQQTQPTYGVDAGIWTRANLWEANALTTASSLALIGMAYHYHFPPLNGYSSFIAAADAANKHPPPFYILALLLTN